MKYFDLLKDINITEETVVTIGSFDGLHLGHDEIFNQLKQISSKYNLKSVVISFYPHPAEILVNKKIPLLTVPEEKKVIMGNKGIDYFILLPFTKELSNLEYDEFVKEILVKKIKMKHLLVGYDHALGKNRQGTYNNLHKLSEILNFGIAKVEPVYVDSKISSSTAIRAFIADGEILQANRFLGRAYNVFGIVEKGEARGRELGFPTANIAIKDSRKLLPKNGVYFVDVYIDKVKHYGMCNIGTNPTFQGTKRKIEVHIFDFSKSIYEHQLSIGFLKFIREEQTFENAEALKNRLISDEKECRLLINKT